MQDYVFAVTDQRPHTLHSRIFEDGEGQKADACDVDVPQGSRLCPPNTNDAPLATSLSSHEAQGT